MSNFQSVREIWKHNNNENIRIKHRGGSDFLLVGILNGKALLVMRDGTIDQHISAAKRDWEILDPKDTEAEDKNEYRKDV